MDDLHAGSPFDPHAPLRLSIAAELALPDGSMAASGLGREFIHRRLDTYIEFRLAGPSQP
jgi:hypothetical protein